MKSLKDEVKGRLNQDPSLSTIPEEDKDKIAEIFEQTNKEILSGNIGIPKSPAGGPS